MSSPRFTHLHGHSHYSLLDGASQIKKLVNRTVELGMNALALTDHGNLHGALEFYQACKGAGINPIVGYEAYIAPGRRFKKDAGSQKESSYHLTLLAQNRTGFQTSSSSPPPRRWKASTSSPVSTVRFLPSVPRALSVSPAASRVSFRVR